MEVKFKYEEWNSLKDILVPRPKTSVGQAMIASGVRVTRYLTRKQEGGRTPGLARDQVVEILAGAIEWARWYGFTPKELENAVNGSVTRSLGSQKSQALIKARRNKGISDINAPIAGLKETRNLPR